MNHVDFFSSRELHPSSAIVRLNSFSSAPPITELGESCVRCCVVCTSPTIYTGKSSSIIYKSFSSLTQDFLSSIILSKPKPKCIKGNLQNLSRYGALKVLEYSPIVQNPPHVNSLNFIFRVGLHPVIVDVSLLIIKSDVCVSVLSNQPAPLWKK